MRFDNGAAVSLEVSWAANIAQDQYDVQLLGSKGGARLNPLQVYGERQGTLVDMAPVSMAKVNPHREEVEHFVACIRGEAAPLITPGQLLDVQHVLDAVYASADAGKEIQISVD